MRQVSPGATRLCDIHDRVENLPSLKTWLPTQPAPLWQILPDNCPFPVAHIAVVLLSGAASQALQQSICFSTSLFTHFFTGSKEIFEKWVRRVRQAVGKRTAVCRS